MVLDCLYKEDFSELYGEGSCGLNIHNVARHLVQYVWLWGRLFAWSTFGFEDGNADIKQAAHGTRDVTKQILQFKSFQSTLLAIDTDRMPHLKVATLLKQMRPSFTNQWTGGHFAKNCILAGAAKTADIPHDNEAFVLQKNKCWHTDDFRKFLRVKIRSSMHVHKLYVQQYTRMYRRICNIVLCTDTLYFSSFSGLLFAQHQDISCVCCGVYV